VRVRQAFISADTKGQNLIEMSNAKLKVNEALIFAQINVEVAFRIV
jgi:hypothetical protein